MVNWFQINNPGSTWPHVLSLSTLPDTSIHHHTFNCHHTQDLLTHSQIHTSYNIACSLIPGLIHSCWTLESAHWPQQTRQIPASDTQYTTCHCTSPQLVLSSPGTHCPAECLYIGDISNLHINWWVYLVIHISVHWHVQHHRQTKHNLTLILAEFINRERCMKHIEYVNIFVKNYRSTVYNMVGTCMIQPWPLTSRSDLQNVIRASLILQSWCCLV